MGFSNEAACGVCGYTGGWDVRRAWDGDPAAPDSVSVLYVRCARCGARAAADMETAILKATARFRKGRVEA